MSYHRDRPGPRRSGIPGRDHLPRTRIAFIIVAMAMTLSIAFAVRHWITHAPSRQDVRLGGAMLDTLQGAPPSWIPGDAVSRAALWNDVGRAYMQAQGQPIWMEGSGPSKRAFDFVIALSRAGEDGLEPDAYDYRELRQGIDKEPSRELADSTREARRLAGLDLRLTVAFLRYFHDRHDGRLPEKVLDPDWRVGRDSIDVVALLEKTRRGAAVRETVERTDLADSAYVRLRSAAAVYARIVREGGWPVVDDGPPLVRGATDPRCVILRQRLARSGDLTEAEGPDTTAADRFDENLVAGLRRFQARHGIPVDGRLDEKTRRSLNVSAASRLRTIELNLEKLRWRAAKLEQPFIQVNVPESHLFVRVGGGDSLAMRAVVGTSTHPTPIFTDRITFLDFNPTWRVPKRIVVEEILPAYRKDKHYFDEHNMKVIRTKRRVPSPVAPETVPWEAAPEDTFGYLVLQEGGETNPLGRIKFMCPNEYDVYLHDTPGRAMFGWIDRFQSHGCVRLERPLDLAAFALRGTKVASRDSIQAILDSRQARRVQLTRPVHVHVIYQTAWVDSDGAVQFRRDVYGLDRRLAEALRTGQVSDFEINALVDWKAIARGEGETERAP